MCANVCSEPKTQLSVTLRFHLGGPRGHKQMWAWHNGEWSGGGDGRSGSRCYPNWVKSVGKKYHSLTGSGLTTVP